MFKIDLQETPKVTFISSYPPRRCGIATFSQDLLSSLAKQYNREEVTNNSLQVIAVDDIEEPINNYPSETTFVIKDHSLNDYYEAAEFINASSQDIVSLQHEFNLFGGEEGYYIINLLNKLKKPVVSTLHTVLNNPNPIQKEIIQEISARSNYVVVMAEKAREILQDSYDIPADKGLFIHHGIHEKPFIDPSHYKPNIGKEGRPVILNFGLLDPKKGIEYVIEAMAEVTKYFPKAAFLVVGKTHPVIRKYHGEEYRQSLMQLVDDLGLNDNVFFHDEFVSLQELIGYLLATDIFITNYLNEDRTASGALAYAMGCGKAIISTPYHYAAEMLSNNHGRLVPFRDNKAIARELLLLLEDNELRYELRNNAYRYSRQMLWSNVATEYLQVFAQFAQI